MWKGGLETTEVRRAGEENGSARGGERKTARW